MNTNKKQTALDYLLDKIAYKNSYGQWNSSVHGDSDINDFVEQAKSMEKEQITEAWINGINCLSERNEKSLSEEYYKETYEA